MESDMNFNKSSSNVVEKLEATNSANSLSNRIYLHKRQSLVRKFSVVPKSPNRKGSSANTSPISMSLQPSPKRNLKKSNTTYVEKPMMLNSQLSVDLQEDVNFTEGLDDSSEVSSLVSWNDKKTNSEMESSRLMFSLNSNILGIFEAFNNTPNENDLMRDSAAGVLEKSPKNKKDSSRQIELIYQGESQPIDDILGMMVKKSVVEENFNSNNNNIINGLNRKGSNQNVFNRNKLNLVQVPTVSQDPWLQLTGWSSFQNFMALLPANHVFHEISIEIAKNPKPWKEILFKSIKECCSGQDYDSFPDLGWVFKTNLSGLQTLVLLKFFRSDELERLVKGFVTKSFPSVFSEIRKGFGLEKLLKLKSTRPLLVFYNQLNFDLIELLENKCFRLNNRRAVKKLVLTASFSREGFVKILDDALEEKLWVLIENFQDLKRNDSESFLKILNARNKSIENSRIIIFYKLALQSPYDPFNFGEQQSDGITLSFFYTCQKIFIQDDKSLKDLMKSLYMTEREEYKAQTHKKTLNTIPNISDKIAPSFKLLKCFSYDLLQHRMQKLKENCNMFFNLHSLLDAKDLLNKNPNFLSVIDAQSKKVRFSLNFLFSIISMRDKINRKGVKISIKRREFLLLIEDVFQFLETYPLNPMVFLDKAVGYILQIMKKEYDSSIFSSLFKEYLSVPQEKQLILSIKNHKYELYKAIPNMSYEENLTKTLMLFPEEDHVELLGFHLNKDYQSSFLQSERLMLSLRKYEQNFNRILKKEETVRIFLDNPHSYKEFLLNQEKLYSKALKKADKLQDLLLSLDLEQSISIKSNLYLSLLDMFKREENALEFPFEFSDDFMLDQPLISANQVVNWLVDARSPSKTPALSPNLLMPVSSLKNPESPSKFKKSSFMFSPTTNNEKRASQVRFEIPRKNTPVVYRSPSLSRNTLHGFGNVTMKQISKEEELPGSKTVGVANRIPSMKNLKMEDGNKEKMGDKDHFENKISDDVIKCVVLSEFLIFSGVQRMISDDIGSLLMGLNSRAGKLQKEKVRLIEQMILENKTPNEWQETVFSSENIVPLCNFCRNLLVKIEHCERLVKEPRFLQSSIINLTKMFDPLAFIYFLLWDYSIEKKVY